MGWETDLGACWPALPAVLEVRSFQEIRMMLPWSWLAGLGPEGFGARPGHGTSLALARQTLFSEVQSLSLCPALQQVGNLLGLQSGQKAENLGQADTSGMSSLSLRWHAQFSPRASATTPLGPVDPISTG